MIIDAIYFVIISIIISLVLLFLKLKILSFLFLLIGLFIIYFFRDPKREISAKANQILAPADGRIVEIKEFFLNSKKYTKIGIFLSLFDVHINRSPLNAIIEKIEYKKGQFRFAFDKKAEELNEQNVIYLKAADKDVILKQIAGIIARRIVFWKKEGESVKAGEKIGMIKFGSRTELILPGDLKLYIKIKDKVKAGLTVIGEWID